jgi:hypothetical protein
MAIKPIVGLNFKIKNYSNVGLGIAYGIIVQTYYNNTTALVKIEDEEKPRILSNQELEDDCDYLSPEEVNLLFCRIL